MSSDLRSLSGVGFSEEAKEVKQFRSLQSKVIFNVKVDLGSSHFRVPVKIPAQVLQNAQEEQNHQRLCSAEVPTAESYWQSKEIQRKAAMNEWKE